MRHRFLSKRMALLLGALAFCGCSTSKDVDVASRAVRQFHEQVNAGQDDAIYTAADATYKEAMTRDTNRSFFSRIRRKLGAFKKGERTGYLVNATTNGTFVRFHYKTHCVGGELEEEFVWRVEADRAILVRYEANSPLLLTN